MALILDTRYPGRMTAANASYPRGSFKNRSAPGALDGSYIERDWANDWNGFFSALLVNAGITANGNVDTALASQYYTAFQSLIVAGVPYATAAEAVAGVITNKAVNPAALHAARMRRINRVASTTVQAIVGTSVAPATFTPLNVSFTADGGMYQIFVKINIQAETINASTAPSNAVVIKLLNGATPLDISASNISVPEFAGRSMVLSWSGVIAPGAVSLTVTFEKTSTTGTVTINGDRDDNTTNASGQFSVIDVYRMGA